MTPDEAVVIVTEAATLGIHVSPADPGHLTDMANGWAEVCRDVPYAYAHKVLIDWSGPYHIRPSQVRGAWEQDFRSRQRDNTLLVEGACAWARVCRCDHKNCFNGQMREAEDRVTTIDTPKEPIVRHTAGVRWCTRCWDARNIVREEHGKEHRAYGDMSS